MAKDFTKKTFSKNLRGYSPEEVDEYLAYVNDEYRKTESRAQDLERKLALALKKIDGLMKTDEINKEETAKIKSEANEVLKKAHIEARVLIENAEAAAVKISEAAAEEAETKLKEADEAAKKIIEAAAAEMKKAREQAAAVHNAVSEMYDEARSFKNTLFSLYNSHIASVESIEENAEKYINGIDSIYTDATGEAVVREDEDYEDEVDEDDIPEESEAENSTVITPKKDVIIDIADEDDGYDAFEEIPDDAEDWTASDEDTEENGTEDKISSEPEDDMAATRVLRLSALSEAIAGLEDFEDEDFVDEYEDEDYEYSEDDDAEAAFTPAPFGALDSLFTSDNNEEYSEKDEFDIVFAEADSRRNVEEIRRQPVIPAEDPHKTKKHKKF